MNLLTVMLQAQGGADYSFLIMMVAIFAIMYFFMIRPQNTAGGIYGKVKELEDNAVIVEIAPSVKIKVDRNSIYADAQAQVNK